MLRILHVSDTQWSDGSEEKAITAFARSEKIDYLIHTGDLIDRKKRFPSAQAWEIIEAKLQILVKESGLPLIIIPGNHDPERFHAEDPRDKRQSLELVLNVFRKAGALVPDGKAMSLGDGVTLSYLNRYSDDDYFYGTAVNEPLESPPGGRFNLAIAHGVGFVPYRKVFHAEMSWPEAIDIERKTTHRRLKEIIELGYDIILCGHHRHSNVPNGLFRYKGKLISLRGQHRTAERSVDPIADYGSLIEIDEDSVAAFTVDFARGKVFPPTTIKELDNG